MKRRRFLVYLIIIVFILSFVSVPAFAAPPSPNHTITVDGSGFDGTGEVAFDLLQDGQSVGSVSSFDGSSLVFSGLSGGTYSISITSVSDGYEASVSPSSVKLVGREKSESFTITLSGGVVEDTEPPVISLLGDNPYTLEGGDVYVEPGYEVTDNVDSPENITVEITGQIDNYTPGSYTLTYTATDSSGNSSIETRTVEVVDTTAPVITLNGSATVTITEGDTYTDEGATAYDIVDGDITTEIVKTGEVDTTTARTYYINYNVSDAAGNPAEEVIRTINVEEAVLEDTEPPVITLLGDNPYTLEGGDVYVEPGYEVTDNVDSPENITVEITGQIDNYTPGSYTLTYTATDSSGNSSIETRTVEVVDTTAPVITLNGSATVTITEGDTYTDEGATAYDIVDGDITTEIVKTGEVDTTTARTYYINYNVSDAAGNPAEEVIRTINVEEAVLEDTEPPVITLLGDNPYTLEGGDVFVEPGYEVTDNVDSPENITVEITGQIDNYTPGSYTLTYTATDSSGNSSIETRTVEVVDTTAPVITLNGSATVTITEGDTYTDEGATAYDIVDGDITTEIVKTGEVDTTTARTYYINYNVSDAAGNPAEEVIRTINVEEAVLEDTEPPVITLLGDNPYTLEGGDVYVEPGYEVTDNVDSPENITVEITGQIDNYTPGSYTLTYTATDSSGNSSIETRTVEVVDTTAPVITLNGSATVTITEGDTYTDEGATAYDIVDGDITTEIVKTGEVDTTTARTYYINYNVSDAAGNPAEEVIRTINVEEAVLEDTEPPVITLLGDNPYTLEGGDVYVEPGYEVTDNVDSPENITVEITGQIDNYTPGSYTLTYTATDSSGNSSIETRTVEVVDTTAPVITLIGSATLTITEGDTYTD